MQGRTYGLPNRATTPLKCEQQTLYRHFCQSIELIAIHKPGGVPMSRTVLILPNFLTPAAKELGYACADGYAMQRVKGGWKQVNDAEYKPVRCRTK